MQTVNGAPFSWLGPVVLGTTILLAMVGIRAFLPRVPRIALSLFAASVPILICSAFGEWPLRCWLFAAVLAVLAWAVFSFDRWVGRGDGAAVLVSCLLAGGWFLVTVGTVRQGTTSRTGLNGPAIVLLALYWGLIISVVFSASRSLDKKRRS
jgi:hypothetical protein